MGKFSLSQRDGSVRGRARMLAMTSSPQDRDFGLVVPRPTPQVAATSALAFGPPISTDASTRPSALIGGLLAPLPTDSDTIH